MAKIDEIEVISSGGVPFYYHSNTGEAQDNSYLLQASFITALTQFAEELDNGQVKLISMERKHYLMTKSSDFTVIFTSYDNTGPEELLSYQPQIVEAKEYLNEKLLQLNIDVDNPNSPILDKPMNDFDEYLKLQELVEGENQYSGDRLKSEFNKLIFKSVGYEPGKCNIGRAERMKRLVFGLVFFTLSFFAFSLVFILNLPSWVVFFLSVPNFFGFLGLFQYFYRFCTSNALNQEFDMN